MSESGMDAFIRGMPKAELHVHVEGTLEPELRVRLAERNGVDLPYRTADELAASYAYQDLSSFLALYFSGMDVLWTEQDFFELAYTYLQRVHAQNVGSIQRCILIRRRIRAGALHSIRSSAAFGGRRRWRRMSLAFART